ncbi:MFS transporter [Sphingomonas sp.]|uniref:MFS transporter n=1 Tax=Sphingomonas sp. TaxID=28214 RepID=UPI002DD69130|nr:MFS transporter [Sphingomonas sp.]
MTVKRRTIGLCFLAAILEGADIVSMGLAAPMVAREFGFGPGLIGLILTATIVGLMIGAAIGGRLGDRWGRKRTLVLSFVVLGIFALATTQAYDGPSFIAARALCGLGIGGAFPNLIAIAAEASPAERRATGIGLMFAGQPVGGTLLAIFVAMTTGMLDWRTIFVIAGVLPLLLAPVLMAALPESVAFKAARAHGGGQALPAGQALFGGDRTGITLLLWVCYGFTQVIVYLLNNWLPTLMVAKGFTPQQAGIISAFENAGAAAGCVALGMLADRGRLRSVLVTTYAITAIGLWALGALQGLVPVVIAGIVVGFFAIGGQFLLYGLAPGFYPVLGRATGVGAAVSVGRLGAISGPLAAGALLAAGLSPALVLICAMPCALIGGAAALALATRSRQHVPDPIKLD